MAPPLSPYLTDVQIKEIRHAFDSLDRDKDGSLKEIEILTLLSQMEIQATDAEVQAFIGDGNDRLNFNQLLALLNQLITKTEVSEQELRQSFALFDQNGDGVVSRRELRRVLSQLGEEVSPLEIERLFEGRDGLDFGAFQEALRD